MRNPAGVQTQITKSWMMNNHAKERPTPLAFICKQNFLQSLTLEKVLFFDCIYWADPDCTAMPGRPVDERKQASRPHPGVKNQFNILDPQWGSYQILS